VMVHACNTSTWKAEAGGIWVQARLGYKVKPCHKTKHIKKSYLSFKGRWQSISKVSFFYDFVLNSNWIYFLAYFNPHFCLFFFFMLVFICITAICMFFMV
jgi:hypothetical protein